MKQLRLRTVEWVAQSHTAGQEYTMIPIQVSMPLQRIPQTTAQ